MPDQRKRRSTRSVKVRRPAVSVQADVRGRNRDNDRPLSPAVATMATVCAPPRSNFAGFCNFCGEANCRKPACIMWYINTWWAVCERCGGLGSDGYGLSCLCLHGVVQVAAERVGAIQPR